MHLNKLLLSLYIENTPRYADAVSIFCQRLKLLLLWLYTDATPAKLLFKIIAVAIAEAVMGTNIEKDTISIYLVC